jgi:catalase
MPSPSSSPTTKASDGGALYYEPRETGAPGPGGSGQEGAWFLVDELAARLAQAPVNFRLKVQLASPGDTTKDPSQPWPDRNEVVELGVLTIDKPVADSLDAQKKFFFLPGQLTKGIETSDDRMVEIRNGA